MNRRDVLVLGAAGAVALAAGGPARGQTKSPAAGDARSRLLAALAECRRDGELCIAHCATELGQGNKSMAKCNLKVHEMMALTGALASLAALDSPHAKKLAALCAEACKACKEACFEHKEHFAHGMHLACKDCGESCERCETACRAYAS